MLLACSHDNHSNGQKRPYRADQCMGSVSVEGMSQKMFALLYLHVHVKVSWGGGGTCHNPLGRIVVLVNGGSCIMSTWPDGEHM